MNRTLSLIQLGLAALLLCCLFHLPYGYYMIVRLAAMAGFGYLALHYSGQQRNTLALVCVGLALLFQPFFKIVLGRMLWNIVDVLAAVFVVGMLLWSNRMANKA